MAADAEQIQEYERVYKEKLRKMTDRMDGYLPAHRRELILQEEAQRMRWQAAQDEADADEDESDESD